VCTVLSEAVVPLLPPPLTATTTRAVFIDNTTAGVLSPEHASGGMRPGAAGYIWPRGMAR
jgi:hypothetical protein